MPFSNKLEADEKLALTCKGIDDGPHGGLRRGSRHRVQAAVHDICSSLNACQLGRHACSSCVMRVDMHWDIREGLPGQTQFLSVVPDALRRSFRDLHIPQQAWACSFVGYDLQASMMFLSPGSGQTGTTAQGAGLSRTLTQHGSVRLSNYKLTFAGRKIQQLSVDLWQRTERAQWIDLASWQHLGAALASGAQQHVVRHAM